jgi:hypothetical protein
MKYELPLEYIIQEFLCLAGYPKSDKFGNVYSGGCPSCREGRSWGVKRRLFFIPEHNRIHCKNCNRSWTPVQFIMEFASKSYDQIIRESKEYEYIPVDLLLKPEKVVKKESDILPKNSINLFDPQQIEYYKNKPIVQEALSLISSRKLDTAVNRCPNLYVSLDDFVHKNRLCIPFENETGKIVFYQTRSIKKDDPNPKYLGKIGGEKTIFGINRISEDLDYIFKFEGPIDSMFVKNGVSVAGVTISEYQQHQLKKFPFHKQIWVLDNQRVDTTSMQRTLELIDSGERVFIWPKTKMKDFNDLAVNSNINEIPTKFIIQNSFSGLQAKLKIKQL